jgi:hypothetical protein
MNSTTHNALIAQTLQKIIQVLISSSPRNRAAECLDGPQSFIAGMAVPVLIGTRQQLIRGDPRKIIKREILEQA